MGEPFDPREARCLVDDARAVEDEMVSFSDIRRLAGLCSRRALMWETMAAGLDDRDLSVVRASSEAIRQCAEDVFRRLWDDGERGDAQRSG
jgi:hypothetical protein